MLLKISSAWTPGYAYIYISKALTPVIRPFCVYIEQVPSVVLPLHVTLW